MLQDSVYLLVIRVHDLQVRKKHFKKNAKICTDDYAKKYSNKVYIGMAVCKGRGDDIKHKVNSLKATYGHNYAPVVKLGFLQNGNFQFLLIYGTFLQEFTSSDMFYHDFRNHLVLF